jgi:uncharacterized protein (UPF0332 family)
MIEKEITNSIYDLNRSKDSIKNKDYKWAAVQAYYSMFHAAKALVLKKNYREKSHYCLLIALKELYVKKDLLDKDMIDNFELCMSLRHDADYGLIYEKESAETALDYADSFLNKTLKTLN